MPPSAGTDDEIASSLADKLRISSNVGSSRSTKSDTVAESWEDEADDGEAGDVALGKQEPGTKPREASSIYTRYTSPSLETTDTSSRGPATTTTDLPAEPPPTPVSPTAAAARSRPMAMASPLQRQIYQPDGTLADTDVPGPRPAAGAAGEERRPDKTTAVASRLIAAAIGQRPVPRTKEQREYDQAMKVQERKRRDAAREEEARKKAEAEKAKKDVWGD